MGSRGVAAYSVEALLEWKRTKNIRRSLVSFSLRRRYTYFEFGAEGGVEAGGNDLESMARVGVAYSSGYKAV